MVDYGQLVGVVAGNATRIKEVEQRNRDDGVDMRELLHTLQELGLPEGAGQDEDESWRVSESE